MPFDVAGSVAQAPTRHSTQPLTLNVRMPDGGWLAPPAEAGHRVIDLLARFGLPVSDACRGRCICGSCRARVAPAWRDRLSPPSADEAAHLSALANGDATTRLICGLVMTPDLDGLEIELDWDALVPQTYWIAG